MISIESTLHISKPCHEDWEAMQSEAQSRYCAVCQRKVVDFTAHTEAQVRDYLSHQSGSICGRLYSFPSPANNPVKRKRLAKTAPKWQLYTIVLAIFNIIGSQTSNFS